MKNETRRTGTGSRTLGILPLFILFLSAILLPPGSAGAARLYQDAPGGEGPGKEVWGGKSDPAAPSWESTLPPGRTTLEDGEVASPPDHVAYPIRPGENIRTEGGRIEVTLVRTSPERPPEDTSLNWNTVLDFVRPDNSSALAVLLVWDSNGREWLGEQSFLEILGPENLWGQIVPLGRRVRQGEEVVLSFTWGSGGNRIHADGKEVPAYWTWVGSELVPSKRDGRFADAVAGAEKIRLGISRRAPGAGIWRHPMVEGAFRRFAVHDDPLPPATVPVISSVADDTFRVAGISGKLVAGDKVAVELVAAPGGKASFDLGRVLGIPMEEVPASGGAPGVPAVAQGMYRGSYAIRPGDDFENGQVTGHFVSSDNVAAKPVASASKWTVDTKPAVTFRIDRKDLPADSSTKTRIKLIAKDANGNAVSGRRYRLTLSTTDEYTGTAGAGDFGKAVGATVETRWRGETDAWGEVEFDFVAGFAAKTVILSAKDLDSGGVTVDYLTSYKEASIDIALTPPISRAAARRGIQYIVKAEASRTELTADGRSRSVIRATLLDPNGTPVAGDPVSFALSSENGTLRTIQGTTDASGTATAEYVAGKKIGIVVVTATATLRNAQGNVSITLLSDAPAKIHLKARPETLPADGFSRADIDVKVTDINDNPNPDTKVEFKVARGGGKLDYADRVTDRFGDATNRYTSGTAPGVASVLAMVRSKVPTAAELARARNVLFALYSPEGDEIRVEKWLKKKGDAFAKGDPLVEYTVGRSGATHRLTAPFDGRMGEQFVEYWDRAEVGQTLAVLERTGTN